MTAPPNGRKFNDDLLMQESDRKLAVRKYPTIYHVLDHPELRKLFLQYDEPANLAKRKGRRTGLWAIGLGFGALALAALEIWLGFPAPDRTAPADQEQFGISLVLAMAQAYPGLPAF
jgi:hypothetical protein